MDRKESLKTLLLGSLSLPFISDKKREKKEKITYPVSDKSDKNQEKFYESPWDKLPDMTWTGEAYWANRLQDWQLNEGWLECNMRGNNRTVYNLNHELENTRNNFTTRVRLQLSESVQPSEKNRFGIIVGAGGPIDDYRSTAIYGDGVNIGVDAQGRLFIGDYIRSDESLTDKRLHEGIELKIMGQPRGMRYTIHVFALEPSNQETLLSVKYTDMEKKKLTGSLALFSHVEEYEEKQRNSLSCRFTKWIFEGQKFECNPDHTYGPIYFAQYTQHNGFLQLTAQLAPVSLPLSAFLEVKEGNQWNRISEAEIEYPSYTAQFKITDWEATKKVPYRVVVELPLRDNTRHTYKWSGTIAEEPIAEEKVKALVMSCNCDYGFPDQEVVDNAGRHEADVVMFVGDQFYERNGKFRVQRDPADKAYLDYLRKWYQFGWSYRELFRHRPSICLPDDHDVYQGNLFGSGGDKVTDKPGPYDRDWGGYVMPAEWVNMVMTTQTSHMPDPYDPEPIKQGIHVFYTDWKYGGVSFGLVEDRKFKSGPQEILPESIEVRDGFVNSTDYDISEQDFPDAELLGERQLEFLRHWVSDWSQGTEFKALVSCTPFHALQTLPNGNESNGQQPGLPIPKPGEYVKGDERVSDMDSNAWPQNKRDDALKILRKGYSLHLNGDQHLASITQYGIDDFCDAGYQFTVPALSNIWPRRWWPPVSGDHQPVPDQPAYTGKFKDAFDNPMYVMAVANPRKTGMRPAELYDRAPGYGVITFDKRKRKVKMECWPRHINPELEPHGQYKGWPLSIDQINSYHPGNARYLPVLKITSEAKPIVRVTHEETGELDHVLRIGDDKYQPVVSSKGTYTVEIVDDVNKRERKLTGLEAVVDNKKQRSVEL